MMWVEVEQPLLAVALTAVFVLIALLFAAGFEIADREMLPLHPTGAVWMMEATRVSYFLLAAIGGALVIRLGVALAPTDGITGESKKLIESVGAAVTAFVTASFASVSADKASETLGKRVRAAFQARVVTGSSKTPTTGSYLAFPEVASDAEFAVVRSVHDLNRSWDTWKDRKERATSMKEALTALGDGSRYVKQAGAASTDGSPAEVPVPSEATPEAASS
jgi:hypothetical protein